MKVLIDTNVVLDVLLSRQEYYTESAHIMQLSEDGSIQGYISASAITDIYYIANKTLKNRSAVIELLKKLLKIIQVAGVTSDSIFRAMELEWKDFEDSVQYSVAESINAKYIITRNISDYEDDVVSVVYPSDFLNLYRCR